MQRKVTMAGKENAKRFSAPAYYIHSAICLLIMFGFLASCHPWNR